eukprot:TRINITY_DN6616_c0_g1_i4.p1 TRINITY_DN6616_c0_g1~~TRINITY_DN6616_c0_g1_i4.p1  ORF type:complete len:1738 (+),score=444.60 TRINITY_DN6616_c0_g1_i4:156-5369(+)
MTTSSKDRVFNTPDAPTFYPTAEQFADPSAFIESIRREGEKAGICVIVPPEGWAPPFSVPEDMSFSPVVQYPHYMQKRLISKDQFMRMLQEFWRSRGRPIQARISIEGVPIELTRLYEEVGRRGGFEKVQHMTEGWDTVATCLKMRKTVTPLSIKRCYERYLLAYELDQTGNGASVRRKAYGNRGANRRKNRDLSEEEIAKQVEYINSLQCSHCKFGGHEDSLVICDACASGTHLHCAAPPLEAVPKYEWFCESCQCALPTDVVPIAAPQHSYTVKGYRDASEQSKQKHFVKSGLNAEEVPLVEIERRYWDIVEKGTEEIEVEYGNDLPNDRFASGFPRGEAVSEYKNSGWNLNNFWKISANMLRDLDERISGVNVPWLYLGQCFSSFCWHNEDCYMYSINYHHCGAPKVWYGVPGEATKAFEDVMRSQMPELFQRQPDLLFQIATMLSPRVLLQQGVPVCRAIQQPGNFIITFPEAYHAGFNSGFNCAEAMNFGLADWLPFGMRAIEHYRKYKHQSVLDMQQLLLAVLTKLPTIEGVETCTRQDVVAEGETLYHQEHTQRAKVCSEGVFRSQQIDQTESTPQCAICRSDTFMSFLRCDACGQRSVCLQHSKHLCECAPESVSLFYRHSLAELEDIIDNVAASTPQQDEPATSADSKPTRATTKPSRGCSDLWLQYAGLWLKRAHQVKAEAGPLEEVHTLIHEVGSYMWRGHDLDNVRALASELVAAADWATKLQTATEQAISLEELKGLVTQDSWLRMPELLEHHKGVIAAAEQLQMQVGGMFQGSVSREQIQELRRMLSTVMVGLGALDDEVARVETWYQQSQLALSPAPEPSGVQQLLSVDELNQLVCSASQLPVLVSAHEVEQLKLKCSQAQAWEQKALPLVVSVTSLAQLEEAVRAFVLLGVRAGPTLEQVQLKLSSAKEWVEAVQLQLEGITAATVTELEARLQQSTDLKVSFAEVEALKHHIELKQWESRAKQQLASAASAERHRSLNGLLLEATEAGFQSSVVQRLRNVVQEHDGLQAQLEQLLSEEKPQHRAVASLLKGLQRHGVLDSRADDLSKRAAVADKWISSLSRVRPSRNAEQQPSLTDAEKLLKEAEALTLAVDEVQLLAEQVKVVGHWQQSAQELLAECTYRSLDVLHRQAPLQLFWVPEMDQIQPQIEKAQWKRRAVRVLSTSTDLEGIEELHREAKSLKITEAHPAVGETLAGVAKVMKQGTELRGRINAALRRSTAIDVLEGLCAEAQEVATTFDEIEELEERLTAAQEALAALNEVLGQESVRFEQLSHAHKRLQQLKVLPVDKTLAIVKAALSETDKWTKEARTLMCTPEKSWSHPKSGCLYEEFQKGTFAPTSASVKDVCYCGDEDYHKKMMISCDICEQWYHAECLNVTPDALLNAEDQPLQCPRCTELARTAFSFVAHLRERPPLADVLDLVSRAPSQCATPMLDTLKTLCEQVQEWELAATAASKEGLQPRLRALALQADSFLIEPPQYEQMITDLAERRLVESLRLSHVFSEVDAVHLLTVCTGYPDTFKPASLSKLRAALQKLKQWNSEFSTALSWQPALTEFEQLLEQSSELEVLSKRQPQLTQIVKQATEWEARAALCLKQNGDDAVADLKALREESVHIPVRLPLMAEIGTAHRMQWQKRKVSNTTLRAPSISKRQRQRQQQRQVKRGRDQEEETYCVCGQAADEVECMMIICNVCKEWFHIDCIGLSEKETKSMKYYFCDNCSETH